MFNKSDHLFLTFTGIDYSRSSVYLNQELTEQPVSKLMLSPNFKLFFKELWHYRKKLREKNIVLVVLSPCSVLVPFLKILTRRPIILDAGWPLTDAELGGRYNPVAGIKYFKVWLIDLMAFHLAKVTILESNSQRQHVSKHYLVSKSKLKVLFTGVNENKYLIPIEVKKSNLLLKYGETLKKDFVLYRGKNNSESGISNIIKVAELSSHNYKFVIVTNKKPKFIQDERNVIFILDYLKDSEIAFLYEKCFLSLGQLSNSRRLNRTIPHKAFESGYFGTPYLSMKRNGITEFLTSESDAIFVQDFDAFEVSKIIESLYLDVNWQLELKENIKRRYLNVASQAQLKQSFLRILKTSF